MIVKNVLYFLVVIPVVAGFIIIIWWMFFALIGLVVESIKGWASVKKQKKLLRKLRERS